MTLADRILQEVQKLPETKQAEILDFVEFLACRQADRDWQELSLASALADQQDEPDLYEFADLKEPFP
jgi:Protein of unknown function (DUF2281)